MCDVKAVIKCKGSLSEIRVINVFEQAGKLGDLPHLLADERIGQSSEHQSSEPARLLAIENGVVAVVPDANGILMAPQVPLAKPTTPVPKRLRIAEAVAPAGNGGGPQVQGPSSSQKENLKRHSS